MDLGLMQREVAERLGVCKSTLEGWERNLHPPGLRHNPTVVKFLGYVPFPEPRNLAERIRLDQNLNEISLRGLASRLKIDETKVWWWAKIFGRLYPALIVEVPF